MIKKSFVLQFIKGCLLTSLIVLLSYYQLFSQQKPERPHYKLLWKISGKQLSKPSYLFGTMHVYDNKAFDFSDSVLLNLLACDAFAMEVHPDSVMNAMVKLVFNNSENKENRFKEIFNDRDYKELDSMIRLKSGYSLEKLKTPSMAEYMLEKNDKKNRDKNTFLDAYLYGIAKTNKKQIIGLENASDQLSIMDNLSPKEIKKIIFSYLKSDSVKTSDYSDSYNQLLSIYYSGDIDKIYELMRNTYNFSKEYYDKLITIRNQDMARNIIKSIEDKSTFVAVGAAHLPGNEGLIKLLENEGYAVTKVSSGFSGLASKYKYKNEESSWSEYTFPKGGYSIKMPTKPIPFKMDSVGITLEMSLDLASGAIYQSTYLSLNNSFEGKDAKYILNQFEESFKRKSKYAVDKSTKIEISGLQGREFWTEDKGDFFRTRLMLRGKTMYLLMVGPTKEHAQSEEGKSFLNSFKPIEFPKETWKEYTNTKGAFKIKHWGEPEVKNVDYKDPDGSGVYHLNIFTSTNSDLGESYLIRYNDFPAGRVSFNDSVYYSTLVDDFFNNLEGKDLVTNDVDIDGFKGKTFSFKLDGEGLVKGITVLRGNRSYFLLTTSLKESENVDYFLKSFKLNDYDTTSFKEYILENANLSLKLPKKPELDNEDENVNKNFLSHGVIYNSIDTKTGVSYIVIHRKVGRYGSYRSSDDFFNKIRSSYLEKSDSLIDSTATVGKDVLSKEYTAYPNKINSYKKIKIMQAGLDVYVLLTYIPKDYLNKPQIKDFFKSALIIAPIDSTPIFKKNTALLFEDLLSEDSIKAEQAKEALQIFEFETSDADAIYRTLSRSLEDDSEDDGIRSLLFDILANLNDEKKQAFIEELYPKLPENGRLRIKALTVLSSMKSKNSTTALQQLLATYPLDAHDPQAATVFYPYLDSIALSAPLFPDVLDQLSHEGFQGILFQLLYQALDSGVFEEHIVSEIDAKINLFLKDFATNIPQLSKDDEHYYDQVEKMEDLILLMGKLKFNQTIAETLYKTIESSESSLMLSALKILIKNNQIVSQKTLRILAETPLTRVKLFQFLKDQGLQQNFPSKYFNKKAFAESALVEYLDYEEGVPESIEYLTVKTVLYKGKKKDLFVFRFKYSEENQWYLGISGPFEKSKDIKYDSDLTYSSYIAYNKRMLDKLIEDMLEGAEVKLIK